MSLKKILLIICCLPAFLCGMTFETKHFRDIVPHVDKDTLVLCDIDYTLLISKQDMGLDDWFFNHRMSELTKKGMSKEQALATVSGLWTFVISKVEVELVDPETAAVLKKLQDQGSLVMGLTARAHYHDQISHDHLKAINISFNQIHDKELLLKLPGNPIVYSKGVVFCSIKNKKSESLLAFFKEIGFTPKRVLFIDDKWNYVRDLESAIEGLGIEFVGVRFGGADERLKNFDIEIAETQWQHLPKLLNNEEARAFKLQYNSISSNFQH